MADVNPYALSTTEDIHQVAAAGLNRNSEHRTLQFTLDMPADNASTSTTTVKGNPNSRVRSTPDSLDAARGWNLWTSAWIRWFYVRSPTTPKDDDRPANDTATTGSGDSPDMPKLAYEDCCAMNVENFLNLIRLDEQRNGRVNASMLRVCWNHCRSRIFAFTLLALAATGISCLAIMLALCHVMDAANIGWSLEHRLTEAMSETNETYVVGFNSTGDLIEQQSANEVHLVGYTVAYVLLIMCLVPVRAANNALALKTAIMLRNTCAGVAYQCGLRSGVQTRIASHQIVGLCAEDGAAIVELVLKGAQIIGHTLSMIVCILTGVIWLQWSGLLGFVGLAVIMAIVWTMVWSSGVFLRKSQTFGQQKLALVEEFYGLPVEAEGEGGHVRRSNNVSLAAQEAYKKRFDAIVSGQFWALFRAEAMRPTFSGAITVYMLMTIVVAIIMFRHIDLENSGVYSALALLFVCNVHSLMTDWGDALMAISHGRQVLERLQTLVVGATDNVPQLPTIDKSASYRLLLENAHFRWDHPPKAASVQPETPIRTTDTQPIMSAEVGFRLHIDRFLVPRTPSAIGIAGPPSAGKSSFVQALLGQMTQRSGDSRRSSASRLSFHPECPYVLESGSLRDNIVQSSGGAFDERIYQQSVRTVQIQMNDGYDRETIDRDDFDRQWMQRIGLARALYNGLSAGQQSHDIAIIENPLSSLDSPTERADIFADCVAQLLNAGTSVILVSNDDALLRHCGEVALIEGGRLRAAEPLAKVAQLAAYASIRSADEQQRCNERNRAAGRGQSLQTAINVSSEDLVYNRPVDVERTPYVFNVAETIYLVLMTQINVSFYVGMPISEFMYIEHLPSTRAIGMIIALLFIIVFLLLTTGLVKHYTHRIGRRFVKRQQRQMFDRVLQQRPTIDAGSLQTQTVAALNALLDGNFRAFQTRSATIYNLSAATVAILMSMLFDYVMFSITAALFLSCWLLLRTMRATVANFGQREIDSRLRLFRNVHNDVGQRVALQSVDGVLHSRNRIFRMIEENSVAIYVQRATVLFSQFLFDALQSIVVIVLLLVIHFDPFRGDYTYVVGLYMYYMVTLHLHGLLDIRFTKLAADLKLINQRKFATNFAPDADAAK